MNQTMPQEFEAMCLAIELGFYYKDSSARAWRDFYELSAIVISEAISDRDREQLIVLKDYLDQILNGGEESAIVRIFKCVPRLKRS